MRVLETSVWKIPGGEIQYKHRSRTIVIWFRRSVHRIPLKRDRRSW